MHFPILLTVVGLVLTTEHIFVFNNLTNRGYVIITIVYLHGYNLETKLFARLLKMRDYCRM
jgi:hypothetical protein